MKTKKSYYMDYKVAKPTLRSFLIDEVSLTAMLLDAMRESLSNFLEGWSKTDEDIVKDIITEHLDRGEIKEL